MRASIVCIRSVCFSERKVTFNVSISDGTSDGK